MNNLGQNAKHITSDANNNQRIPKTPPQTLYYTKTPKTQENIYETFYHGYYMHNTTQIKYHTQK